MATKQTAVSVPGAADTPTPENTPLPGGGSWHWDATLPGWVENPPYAPPVPETTPVTPL